MGFARPQRVITASNGDFVLYEPDEDRYSGHDKNGALLSRTRTVELLNRSRTKYKGRHGIIEAEHGFHGTVNGPTYFLAGEKGSERVDIYRHKSKHKTPKPKSSFGFISGY